MTKERNTPPQLSFVDSGDAALMHMLRRFVAEADRIYRGSTGRGLAEMPTVTAPVDVYEFLAGEMAGLDQEQIRVLNLNSKHGVISAPMIYQGTVSSTDLRLAEIFRPAIIENAVAIIVAHNHPSGDPEPSSADVKATRNIVEVGRLLDIDVLDHIVIGAGRFVSLRDRGLGFGP